MTCTSLGFVSWSVYRVSPAQDSARDEVVFVRPSLLCTGRILSRGHVKVHSIKAVAVAGVCLGSLPSLGICKALPEVICVILCHKSALILFSNDFRAANLYPVCLYPMMIQLSLPFLAYCNHFMHPLVSLSSFSLSCDLMCVIIFMLVLIIRFCISLLM